MIDNHRLAEQKSTQALPDSTGEGLSHHGSSSVIESFPLALKMHERRRIMQQSRHLLQAIEKTLVQCVHEQPQVDDRIVGKALACAIQLRLDDSEWVSFVIAKLALTAVEIQAADGEWRDALRVVYNSLKSQSGLEPGEYSYLIYTSALIAHSQAAESRSSQPDAQ